MMLVYHTPLVKIKFTTASTDGGDTGLYRARLPRLHRPAAHDHDGPYLVELSVSAQDPLRNI